MLNTIILLILFRNIGPLLNNDIIYLKILHSSVADSIDLVTVLH